jgi:hypothetical protein
VTADGVAYHVVAERDGHDLDEFAVSDDLSTVALLWNINGCSELQILADADNTLGCMRLPCWPASASAG